MRIIWLRIKMFFLMRSTQHFLKTFIISFILMTGLIYFIIVKWVDSTQNQDIDDLSKEFMEIIDIPHTTENNMIIQESRVNLQEAVEQSHPYLWEGDALNYRYTIPRQGVPTN